MQSYLFLHLVSNVDVVLVYLGPSLRLFRIKILCFLLYGIVVAPHEPLVLISHLGDLLLVLLIGKIL